MKTTFARISTIGILGLTLILLSCTIDRAPMPATGDIPGQVVIRANANGYNLAGATIKLYLDDIPLIEAQTPDTIQTTVGDYTVRVEYPSWQTDTVVQVSASTINAYSLTLTPTVPAPPVASLQITAVDSSVVFFNGAQTAFTTPATLTEVPAGKHTIGTGKLGYDYQETTTTVSGGASVNLTLTMPTVPWNGVKVSANLDSVRVCLDDQLFLNFTPWILTGIADGYHSFSGYREGYATNSPTLLNATQFLYGSPQELTFTLSTWPVGTQAEYLAPGFALQTDFLDTVALGGYRGRVVLVNFWFKDCQPCMAEMPDIQQAYVDYVSEGFRVLAVNSYDELEDLQTTRENLELTFELLLDPVQSVKSLYGAFSFPTNILIDQRGVIYWRRGSLTYDDLKSSIETLLSQ